MKETAKKITAFIIVMMIVSSCVFMCSAAAVGEKEEGAISEKSAQLFSVINKALGFDSNEKNAYAAEDGTQEPYLKISSEALTVVKGKTLQLSVQAYNFDADPAIVWCSSDQDVAKVDGNGLVKALKIGKATITASCNYEEKTYSDSYVVNVVTRENFVKDLLVSQQILSYQYSYVDDYYYTNDEEAWQKNFGFGKVYDLAAPWVAMEYDYVRVFFEYAEKDWMIQLWKGQYGYVFYGSEIGVYNKAHSDKSDGVFTFYESACREDWLPMTMTLYRDIKGDGNYVRLLTREYEEHWWCTGFKDGHLRRVEPASELRLTGTITFKDEEMTSLFVQGLIDCGLEKKESEHDIGLDEFFVNGNDVTFMWQNISEAENTIPIKIGLGVLTFINFVSFFMMILGLAAMLMMGLFWIIILL